MNIYKLSQTENKGWDTFDSMIVIAENEDQAKLMFPHSDNLEGDYDFSTNYWGRLDYWATSPKNVNVELLGMCYFSDSKPKIVLASFNAG